ncbi:MAG: hypothetical protein M3Y57_00530 [Acidobacteriota bacterium]|nr:hypothetical protein [Acidobacteriota bacterium]
MALTIPNPMPERRIGVAALIRHFVLAGLWRSQPLFEQWPPALVRMLSALAILGGALVSLRRWTATRD